MTPSALEFINALPGDIGPKFLQELQRRQDLVHNPCSSLDGRNQRRNSRAPHQDSGFSISTPSCAGMASLMAGHVEASKGALVPLASPSTLHGLPPSIDGGNGGIKNRSKGAIMANTITSSGFADRIFDHNISDCEASA